MSVWRRKKKNFKTGVFDIDCVAEHIMDLELFAVSGEQAISRARELLRDQSDDIQVVLHEHVLKDARIEAELDRLTENMPWLSLPTSEGDKLIPAVA